MPGGGRADRRRAPRRATSTRSPSRASARAHAAPTMPAPTTIASADARRVIRRAPRPPRNGSCGSKRSVASPVTNAVPRTCGTSAPSGPRVSQPVNRLPVMLSCRQRSPNASCPRACSAAIIADVPVPHGERSYSPPRAEHEVAASASARDGGAESSMWSMSRAVGAGDAGRAQRVLDRLREARQLARVRQLDRHTSTCVRKNQLPPYATSPTTRPTPGHVDRDVARDAARRHVLDRHRAVGATARRSRCRPACRTARRPA